MFLTFKLIMCFIDCFNFGMKSQSIAYSQIGSAHIYWILDFESEVHSIWDLSSRDHAQPCPHTLVFQHCSAPALQCSGDLGLGHYIVSRASVSYYRISCLGGGVKMGQAPPWWSHMSQQCVTTWNLAFSKKGWLHGITTLSLQQPFDTTMDELTTHQMKANKF